MWEPATFLVAWGPEDTCPVAGYVYRGLGLYRAIAPSPKGRRPATWCLVHLNSGHAACWLRGDVATVFPIAAEIAEASDWDFDGLRGWLNRDPELREKVSEIAKRHPRIVDMRTGTPGEVAAQRVLASREAA